VTAQNDNALNSASSSLKRLPLLRPRPSILLTPSDIVFRVPSQCTLPGLEPGNGDSGIIVVLAVVSTSPSPITQLRTLLY
jgi:hypothetical protein